MKLFKKIKRTITWAVHYKVMVVTVDKNISFEHRIFRAPKIVTQKNPKGLRGKSIEVLIFDEAIEVDTYKLRKLLEGKEK